MVNSLYKIVDVKALQEKCFVTILNHIGWQRTDSPMPGKNQVLLLIRADRDIDF